MSLAPFLLPTPDGQIAVTCWQPGKVARGAVLFLPPFAEEMNKCRAMMALASRWLAADGWQVLLPDLRGTGDSWGDFGNARVSGWVDDLGRTAAWARDSGIAVTALVGVRAGALLAAALLPALPDLDRLVLWQPVTSGERWLRQFLRLRVTGGRLAGQRAETVDSLTADLRRGSMLEVAGYEVSPGLAADLAGLYLADPEMPQSVSIRLLEVSGVPDAELSQPARQWLGRCISRGYDATGTVCEGPAFWSTVEVTTCPELARVTSLCLSGDRREGGKGPLS